MYADSFIDTMIEIKLKTNDDFLKIRETLTRIGIANKDRTSLYQSVYILHKRGKFYLVHFKEMFVLDGKQSNLSIEDIARRNTIANMLFSWNMCSPVKTIPLSPILVAKGNITIVPFAEKGKWNLVPKYSIGKRQIE